MDQAGIRTGKMPTGQVMVNAGSTDPDSMGPWSGGPFGGMMGGGRGHPMMRAMMDTDGNGSLFLDEGPAVRAWIFRCPPSMPIGSSTPTRSATL